MRRSNAAEALRAKLRSRVYRHLSQTGFIRAVDGGLSLPGDTKDVLRQMHVPQRRALLRKEKQFISEAWPRLSRHFAGGQQVDPADVWPTLEPVESGTWQAELFRLASLTWSIPVSQGYGRRMRFLVWDESNGCLIGLIALGDPVFNLRARDQWIGWSAADRKKRLVNVMDAYVLGALPPYSFLRGGKLVASLIWSRQVRDFFAARYSRNAGVISGTKKRPSLALVTTTSAFGRSSLYNRLSLDGHRVFASRGFTTGYGHFHFPEELFQIVREYLHESGSSYSANFAFGEGPNWRMRAIRQALRLAGLNPELLRHGIQRELFTCELADNALSLLRGEERQPRFDRLQDASDVGCWARERWMVPRSFTHPDYRQWSREDTRRMLSTPAPYHEMRAGHELGTGTDGAS